MTELERCEKLRDAFLNLRDGFLSLYALDKKQEYKALAVKYDGAATFWQVEMNKNYPK